MAPLTQKALILHAKFGNYSVGTAQVPKPGSGEMLLKVKTAALNPADWKLQKYGLVEKYPAILGLDIAGDVEEIGEGVTEFQKGDRVVTQAQLINDFGGFQQYALAIASTVAKIPSNISYDEAAAVPMCLTAPYVGLYNQKPAGLGLVSPVYPEGVGKYSGNPIFILGGTSSIGQNAIQLAKLSGFSPIITTASLKHAEFLKSIGATHVIDRSISTSNLASEISGILTQNVPLKYAIDSISIPDTQQTAYDVLAQGGKLITFLPSVIKATQEKDIVYVFGSLREPVNIELLETLYHDNLERLLKEGAIKPNRVEILPNGLAGIQEGLNRLEAGQVSRLKLVVHPQDTA